MFVGLEFSMYPHASLKHRTILLASVMPDDSGWLLCGALTGRETLYPCPQASPSELTNVLFSLHSVKSKIPKMNEIPPL